MSVSWETVLIASIPAFLTLIGVIYNDFRKKKNLRNETDASKEVRREPTWNELVTENRNLRAEMTGVQEKADEARDIAQEIRDDLDAFRKEANATIRALTINQELADHRELLLYNHTRALRNHIINELPPPPPEPPKELVEWFETLESHLATTA